MKTTEAINQTRAVIRRQNKALATEEAYLFWLRRYIGALREIAPELSSEKKVERFLSDLALRYDVAASTHQRGQAVEKPLGFHGSSALPLGW